MDLAGDGRCDSPGFNAKYGTYILIFPDDRVIDLTIVHVAEVNHLTAMEKSYVRTINRVELDKISITSIRTDRQTDRQTDRHIQIKAYLAKERPDLIHQFDIWHFSKSIKQNVRKKQQLTRICRVV